MGEGLLEVKLFAADQALPVGNVKILVKDTSGSLIYEMTADENGVTRKVALYAPDMKDSLDPYSRAPRFSIYDVVVPNPKGYKRMIVHGVQIFDKETSILPVQLHPEIIGGTPEENTDEIFIPVEHGADIPRQTQEQGIPTDSYMNDIEIRQLIQANEVAIPEYITVHLGSPNAVARNVRLPFIDYVKNVASSEIFPNWEEAALYANIYAQISFVLNRIYTVWYRSRNFDFDITNSTAFDQYFVEGRNIFENISRIVDGIFNNFIRRQGRREPFFAQYCNGTTSTCNGLSQWGSQDLAKRGYSAMQILRYYYPDDIQIVESNNFTTKVGTFPGTPLKEGSSGEDVRLMQIYLNRISGNYYIPAVGFPDGVFGSQTKTAVARFQEINNLIPDGIIGKNTWYAITKIYVAVANLAELNSEGERIGIGTTPPTVTVQMGSRGEYVVELQFLLNYISEFFTSIPFVVQSSVFRDDTKRSVIEFQKEFGLTPDGVVGPATWRKLYDVFHSIQTSTGGGGGGGGGGSTYPGYPLRIGSRGEDVRYMQSSLQSISKVFPVIPTLTADGVFGTGTQSSVIAFQRFFGLTADGVIGPQTWDRIVSVRNNLPTVSTPVYPGTALRVGSTGNNVTLMQKYLNAIAAQYPSIPVITADGIFGANTERAVKAFQSQFGLTADGVIGINTWNYIVSVYNRIQSHTLSTMNFGSAGHANPNPNSYLMLLALSMMKRY